MKSVIRSFRLTAKIFSPVLLIVVELATQYIANPVNSEKKAECPIRKKTPFLFLPA
jgi:hypothetical protein